MVTQYRPPAGEFVVTNAACAAPGCDGDVIFSHATGVLYCRQCSRRAAAERFAAVQAERRAQPLPAGE
jgi:ribosomal protein S27E